MANLYKRVEHKIPTATIAKSGIGKIVGKSVANSKKTTGGSRLGATVTRTDLKTGKKTTEQIRLTNTTAKEFNSNNFPKKRKKK